jgi:AcrR family transcriptional regulator
MEKEGSRRNRKKQETRQRLIEAALRLFCARGYDATTVEQITEAADVAKSTFFNYFETKEAVVPALIEWRLEEVERSLTPGAGTPTSPVARIKLALRLIAEDPLIDPTLAQRLFVAVAHQQRRAYDVHPGRALTQLLTDQVRQAQVAEEMRTDLDPLCIACVIRAAFFQQTMMWHLGYHPMPLRELLDQTIDMLLDGIGGPQWRKT